MYVPHSIGIDDVMPREKLLAAKAATLDRGYTNVQVGERFTTRSVGEVGVGGEP